MRFYQRLEQQKQYALAKSITEGETRIQKGIAAYAQAVSEGTASAREEFKGNRYALQGAGGGGRSGGGLTDKVVEDSIDEILAKEVNLNVSDLSDKTKAAIDDYVQTMMKNMVKSYEIKDVKEESDSVGKVTASVTFGFDPEAAGKVDVNAEVEQMATDYMNANMAELTNIYMTGGQTALMQKVLDDLVEDILDLYTDAVMKTGETTQDVTFVVEKVDDKWLISGEE